jgi:hypothetical protein
MAILSSSRVALGCLFRAFFWSREKKLSPWRRLSPAAPTLPFDQTMSWRPRARTNFRLRNCDPSVGVDHTAGNSPRLPTALFNAATASRDFIRDSIE